MVGVVDVTTVQEYTGATHRLHTADLAPAVSTACCFHSPVSSLVYLLFCVHFVLGFHRIGWCWGQGSTCWYYSGPSELSRQRIDWVIVRKIFNSQWLLFKVRWRHWKRVVNFWNSSRIPNLFGTSRELSVWERSGCQHKSNCHNAQSRVHKIKYLPKCHDLTTQVVRQGGAKSDGWTSVKEGGNEKTSEQQKNSANDDQPNTNVVFYKVRQKVIHD